MKKVVIFSVYEPLSSTYMLLSRHRGDTLHFRMSIGIRTLKGEGSSRKGYCSRGECISSIDNQVHRFFSGPRIS